MKIKLIFFSSSARTIPALNKLHQSAEIEIAGIVTRTDKPLGRKKIPTPSAAAGFAIEKNIPLIKLENFSSTDEIKKLKPDLIVVYDFGLLIPQEVINFARYGGVNIHFSLLPKLRGAAPLQWAILNGDVSTGITVSVLSEKIDSGDIVYQLPVPIKNTDTTVSLSGMLADKTVQILEELLLKYCNGEIKLLQQYDKQATYAPKLTKEDGLIRKENTAVQIDRMVRALNPWPGVYTFIDFKNRKTRLKILKCRLDGSKLIPEIVQLEGRSPQEFVSLNLNLKLPRTG